MPYINAARATASCPTGERSVGPTHLAPLPAPADAFRQELGSLQLHLPRKPLRRRVVEREKRGHRGTLSAYRVLFIGDSIMGRFPRRVSPGAFLTAGLHRRVSLPTKRARKGLSPFL